MHESSHSLPDLDKSSFNDHQNL